MFIELTLPAGTKHLVNINNIVDIWPQNEKTIICSSTGIEQPVLESYNQILECLSRNCKVLKIEDEKERIRAETTRRI